MSVSLHHVARTANVGRSIAMLFAVVYQILSVHPQIVNQNALLVQIALRTRAAKIKNASILVLMHVAETLDVLLSTTIHLVLVLLDSMEILSMVALKSKVCKILYVFFQILLKMYII